MHNQFKRLWADSAALTFTGLLMLAAFVPSLAGVFLDSRMVTAAPVWLKPAKFAISTAIFAFSIAWLFRYLTFSPSVKRMIGISMSFILILEVGLIDLQAARGVASHFNTGSPVNAAIYFFMGSAIGVLWGIMIGLTIALFRQKFTDSAWGWALRYGMLVSVLGAGLSGFMVRPTPEQSAAISHHARPQSIGAHTVGAPDGGPGIAAVDWSKQHGDLRIPHFFGLHALQILPILAWTIKRRSTASARQQTRMVLSSAGSYVSLVGILTWQALRGQSIIEPDSVTLSALTIWLCATVAALGWSRYTRHEARRLSQLQQEAM